MRSLFSRLTTNEAKTAYKFLLPNLLGFLAFTLLPVLVSLALSFFRWDIFTTPKFVGFANFVRLLGFHRAEGHLVSNDPLFWKFLYNTVYLLLNVPICMVGSLIVALALSQKLRGITIFRTIFYLPTICAGVAVCLLWMWILNPDFGMLNSFLIRVFDLFHLRVQPPQWLNDIVWVKPSLMLMGFWTAIGGTNMLLYLAALSGVPRDLYEAAELDGAGGWKKFWAVTVPFISPTTFFIFVMGIIGGFQSGFMQSYIMTQGGPVGSSTTIDYYIFNNAYQWFKMGYASAIAWFLFLIILLVTLVNWRFGGKLVNY